MFKSKQIIRSFSTLFVLALVLSTTMMARGNEIRVQLRHQEGVPYLSGGIGVDQREELNKIAAKEKMNLKLEFAQRDGAFLSAVPVTITDPSGVVRLQVTTDGPWLFVRLPEGEYRFRAERNGKVQSGTVTISEKERTQEIVSFSLAF